MPFPLFFPQHEKKKKKHVTERHASERAVDEKEKGI